MADEQDDKDAVPAEPAPGEGKTRMFEMKMESWLQDFAADFGPDAPPGPPEAAPPAAGPPPAAAPFQPQAFPGLLDPSALLAAAAGPPPPAPLVDEPAPMRPSAPNMPVVQGGQATDPFASTVLAPSPFAPPQAGAPPEAPAPPAAPFPEVHSASAVPPIPALTATAVPPIPGLVPGAAPLPLPSRPRWIGVLLVACMLMMFAALGTAAWWFLRAPIRALLKI